MRMVKLPLWLAPDLVNRFSAVDLIREAYPALGFLTL